MAADAVVIVVGVEAGEVAELGLGAAGQGAAAVAVGAHRRAGGQRARRAARRSRPVFSGSKRRAASAFSLVWSVFRIVTQELENRSSVQIACSRPWAGVSFRSLSEGTRCWVIFIAWPPICFIETRPMFALWQASSALLSGASLPSHGLNLSMITSMKPPVGGVLQLLGDHRVVGREADELDLARLLEGLDGLLHLLALGPVDLAGAEAVEEEQVDVVGAEPLEALVELLEHVDGSRTWLLVARKMFLRTSGSASNHSPEDALGVLVALGGVEVADAFLIREAEQPVRARRLADGPLVEDRHLDARLAQHPGRQHRLVLAGLSLGSWMVAGPGPRPRPTYRQGSRRQRLPPRRPGGTPDDPTGWNSIPTSLCPPFDGVKRAFAVADTSTRHRSTDHTEGSVARCETGENLTLIAGPRFRQIRNSVWHVITILRFT